MTTDLYRKLNNYDYSPKNLVIIYKYLETGRLPRGLKEEQRERYKLMLENFIINDDDELYYIMTKINTKPC
jgi:hypothetical protein